MGKDRRGGGDVEQLDAKSLHMIRGKYHDLSKFVHPGGELVIRQSVGTDVTASVASHHFTDAPYAVMTKFEVEAKHVRGAIEEVGYAFEENGFYETLKRRVVEQVGQGKAGVRRPVGRTYKLKVAASILTWLITWVYCCTQPFCWPVAITCSALRLVLTGIAHESIHGRIPELSFLWDVMLMMPSEIWHRDHCLEHHPHCKRLDFDPDETFPPCRMNALTPWAHHHVIQVATQTVMSLFIGIAAWIMEHLMKRVLLLQSTCVLFATQLAPLFVHPDGFYTGLAVHFVVVMLANTAALHAFHMSHINEHNSSAAYEYKDGVDWGEHQLRTTSNWTPNKWFSVSGMLEMQIEHHLFPSLSFALQQEIRPLVKKTAAEFNLPYFEYPSIFHGIASHCDFMHKLGKDNEHVAAKGTSNYCITWLTSAAKLS
eukprot:TRINITY_DN12613_c0_g1_i2.p1 TRINITY_DN12613_c0_g1~~TRINITY_DN12613_c0_g1_i2.p1  ORF type:complete len:427 (+),score=48.87 TRINITY_DN12613_c0_g1_i2:52-1332(+)